MADKGSDAYLSSVMATGMLMGLLVYDNDGAVEVELESDSEGQATPTLLARFPRILKSQYRISIELIPDTERPESEEVASGA